MVVLKLIVLTFFVVVCWSSTQRGKLDAVRAERLGRGAGRGRDRLLRLHRLRRGVDGGRGSQESRSAICRSASSGRSSSARSSTSSSRWCSPASFRTACSSRSSATEQAEPLTMAMQYAGLRRISAVGIVAFGSVVAHTAVLLVFQLGQPRIFFSMARDGLLPPSFAKVHPRFRTPHVTTILTGVARRRDCAMFTSIDEMVDLTNIGTLFAFILVCIGILILRKRDPGRPRALQDAVRSAGPDPGHRLVPATDARPAVDHLAAVRAVAAAGIGDLLLVRLQAQRASPHVRLKADATYRSRACRT